MNDAVVSPERRRVGAAALVLDCLLLVQQPSLGIRTADPDPQDDEHPGSTAFPFELPVPVEAVAPGTLAPLGGVAVLDRLEPGAPLEDWVRDLCRRVAGIAVTHPADVDTLTDLVDGPVAFVGNPLPGVLTPASAGERGTTLVPTGATCPVCALRSGRLSSTTDPDADPLRILHEAGDADSRCAGCRGTGERVEVQDPWDVPGLLRGTVVVPGGAPHPLADLVRRVAEATGRRVVDPTGTALAPVPWSSEDSTVVAVADRMTAVVLQVLQRQPLRRTAGWFGDRLAAFADDPTVVATATAAFGELFASAMDPTPWPPRDGEYPSHPVGEIPLPRGPR